MTRKKAKLYDRAYEQYNKYIYAICYRFTQDVDDAMDLTQDVFIKIYKNLNIFKNVDSMKAWIRTVTVNTCLTYKRSDKSHKLVYDTEDITIAETIKSDYSTENQVILEYTRDRALEIIHTMHENIKMAMILRHYDDLSYLEIARAMNVPEGTVKTYIFKGRKILKDQFTKEGLMEVIQ
jgi:RNA polymerase sigma-70 factor (ECF subfamily)